MKEIIEYLKDRTSSIKKYNEPMNSASWGYEEGCIITGEDAQKIIDFYERHESKAEPLLDIDNSTPEWDKIPEPFNTVVIDRDGVEYAYHKSISNPLANWENEPPHKFPTGRRFNMDGVQWVLKISNRIKVKK